MCRCCGRQVGGPVQQRLATQAAGDIAGFADRGPGGLAVVHAEQVGGVVEQAVGQVVGGGVLAQPGDRGSKRRVGVRACGVGEAGTTAKAVTPGPMGGFLARWVVWRNVQSGCPANQSSGRGKARWGAAYHCRRGERELADAAVFPGPDGVFDPGVDPVGDVEVGILAQPAFRDRGPVRHPQAVSPAVPGLEQGELGTGMRPLAPGEDPHRLGPAAQLVPGGAVAQQRRQLGDVRIFDPAPAPGALQVAARLVSAPLTDLAAGIDRDLPGAGRDGADRSALPAAQSHPAE